jgi:hypothetical protein
MSTRHTTLRALAVAAALVPVAIGVGLSGQAPRTYRAPRLDGHPNLSGIWQAINTANWNLQGHQASAGPVLALGAVGAIPAGLGVVEGEDIPYKPEALAKRKANGEHWLTEDPEVKCYLPGVPRATYQPFPFQIVQGPDTILVSYEFAGASRIVYMDNHQKPPVDTWMGWSNGRWEGETLVIDVTGFNDMSWFDRAGNYHSDKLHVVERYTAASPDILNYEATIEDPVVFTRPWKISMPLYRRVEKNAQLLEFKCVEFVEELIYGQYKKQTK